MLEHHYHVFDASGTEYRLIPNPDGGDDGFKSGAVLQTRDKDGIKWKEYFFISSDALGDFATMFKEAAGGSA